MKSNVWNIVVKVLEILLAVAAGFAGGAGSNILF